MSWRADSRFSTIDEPAPDREVEHRAADEERRVQVRRLVPQDLVGLHVIGVGPDVEAASSPAAPGRTARTERNRPARRLEDAAEHAPGAARQVLDHHQRHRAERDAEEQQVGDQPRPEEVIAVDDEPERADGQPDDAGDQRARAAARRCPRRAGCRSSPRYRFSCAGR